MDSPVASNKILEVSKPGQPASPPSNGKPSLPVKIACTECRRQKIKCDANVDVPCSRCRKVKALCKIVAPMRRASKRKLLNIPTTSLPKRRLEIAPNTVRCSSPASQAIPLPGTPISIGTVDAGATDSQTSTNFDSSPPTNSSQSNSNSVAQNYSSVAIQPGLENSTKSMSGTTGLGLEELGLAAEMVRGDLSAGGKEYVRPTSRVFDGMFVDGKAIEDIFKLYFLHYSPILPVLDDLHPDHYYAQLPFLFWCIVAVGSRRYSQDPTIFHSITQRVLDAAGANIISRPMTVPVIQSLLLLLTWGSWDRLSSKTGFPLSGLLVHLSMHMGLHNPLSGHDFLSTRTKLSDDERRRRSELWAHCVIVYQRSSLRIGFPPLNVPRPKLPKDMQKLSKSATSMFDLEFEVSLHDLMARAFTALTDNGLKFESVHQERGMCIILKIFEDQLTDLENKAAPLRDFDKLYLSIGRLMIQSMYLFQSPENIDLTCRTRMYITASQLIQILIGLDNNAQLLSFSTTYISLGVILAAVILLRFLKGSFAKYIDYDSCKASFFSSLTMLKNASVEDSDGSTKFAMRLSHIWDDDTMFKMPDGTRNEELRVRSRLAMSVVFDTVWWFQDVDGCKHPKGKACATKDIGAPEQSPATEVPAIPFEYFSSFDDQIPFDLGCALSDDLFFASWQQPGQGSPG